MLRVLLASESERRLQWLGQNLSFLGAKIDSRPLLASEISAPQGLAVRKQVEMICRDKAKNASIEQSISCLLYTSPSPRDRSLSRMPSSA